MQPLAPVIDQLDRADGGVAVVVAPGGYGKTSQVALWTRTDRRPVTWVDIETSDDDVVRLLDALVDALAAAGVQLDVPTFGRRTPHQYATIVAPELARAIRRSTTPFVLVLDDVHHLQTQPSIDLVDALIGDVPAGSTVVLIGRSMPPLALAKLRATRRAIDITTDQLSLDAPATRAMLEALGASLDDSTIDDLLRHTEGWPLGVQLVGGALAETAGAVTTARALPLDAATATHAYVEDEWLRDLEPDDAALLQRVSGLGWVSGALCDHVLGTSDSGTRLERLHTSGLLVAPLDRRGDSYRVHQVVRETLDDSFRRRDRTAHRTVHQRASDWFESTGEIDRAVEHALRVDHLDRAARLIIEHGPSYHTQGHTHTVKRWLDQLPEQVVTSTPGLCLIAAVVALGTGCGEKATVWTQFGEHALAHGLGDPDGTIGPELGAFRAMLWLDPIEDSLAMASRADDALPPGIWRAFARATKGALSFAIGDDDAAISSLSAASTEAALIGSPTIQAIALAHIALVHASNDRWDDATGPARQARQLLREHGLEHMPTIALVTAASAVVEATFGEADAAGSDILLTRTHLAFLHSVADWHHLLSRIALAFASLRLGDFVAARTFEREVETLLEQHRDAVRYRALLADLASQTRKAQHALPYGPSSLTTAELRVLHYLPTNLTHEEIAGRLYVSRNTAKSHAAAIYRKLGATSRSEAVAVARLAGLLPEE